MSSEHWAAVCRRYRQLYVGAISDILDKNGYRHQALPFYIRPFTRNIQVAGPAFTGQGFPCADKQNNDTEIRLSMLDSIEAGTVSVWACGGSTECAHWGEMMSMAASQRGCSGAVIDGGVRDLDFVDRMEYPVFARFQSPASSVGRWAIREWQVPIRIGNTVIHPGDFIFGDTDGVVVVPRALTIEVLQAAEDIFQREGGMREELRRGVSVKEAYSRYGSL
ncbi:MAG: RraA family protein [Bryobacterales bacterium]|nr:RraA family protein [Bryobacterales bacterium]